MAEYGRPTADKVGEEAARAAWLIAQYADRVGIPVRGGSVASFV
ncbi:hypothetical protein ACFU7C_03625 [Streptomyces bacillaris]